MRELGPFDERCVDVECRHVIHEDGDTKALAVGEDVLEQRGLAGAEESREQSHRDRPDACGGHLLVALILDEGIIGAASGAFLLRIDHLNECMMCVIQRVQPYVYVTRMYAYSDGQYGL